MDNSLVSFPSLSFCLSGSFFLPYPKRKTNIGKSMVEDPCNKLVQPLEILFNHFNLKGHDFTMKYILGIFMMKNVLCLVVIHINIVMARQ